MGVGLRNKSGGYTLIEIMMIFLVLMASITGVYVMLKPAALKAGIEKEQRHLGRLVEDVRGGFGRTQGSYAGLSNQALFDTNPDGVTFENPSTIVSKMGDTMLVRPAEVRQYGDAFDVVYQGLNRKKCLNYVKTFFPQSYTVLVGSSQEQVQDTLGSSEGRLISDALITNACNAPEFTTNMGVVVFRFFEPMAMGVGAIDPACGCTPETQTQDLPCGAGQSGVIRQERTSACTGGTSACPEAEWTNWTTTGNTCTGAPIAMVAPIPVATPATRCTEITDTRIETCTAGERGMITEERSSTCASPTSLPVWSAWTVRSNSCAAVSPASATCGQLLPDTQNLACPGGQIGAIVQKRFTECSGPFATPVYSPWVEVSRNCRMACADANNCCQPLPDQFRPFSCGAGFFGAGTERRTSWCDAANPDTGLAPFWNAWFFQSGTPCTACPAPSTATEERWTAQTGACPAGQYGSTGWEREEQRSQTTTYSCPAGTTTLPPPTIAPWTGWLATGVTRSPTGSCTACPAPTHTTATQWVASSAACPIGQVGSHTWEREQTRTRSETYSCPAGTLSLPSSTVSFSGWTDTGMTRNVVNTCAVPVCAGLSSDNQWIAASSTCPLGQVGSIDWEKEQARSRTCSTPPVWDAWSAWSDTGATRNVVNTCAAGSCAGLSTDTQWIPASVSCPLGEAGTHAWEKEQARSRTCTLPPTWDTWSAWTDTGNTRNTVNTCTPVACSGSASELQWLPASAACELGYIGTRTWEKEQLRSRLCTTPPTWDPWGGWSDTGSTRNSVNTCVLECVAPATSSTTLYRGAPWVPNAVREFDASGNVVPAGTGCRRQEHNQREQVIETTTWSCPGPSPSVTQTYGGPATYELDPMGAWATVSDTCVAPPVTCPTWTGTFGSDNEDDGNSHDIFSFRGIINGLTFDFICDSNGIGVGFAPSTCSGHVGGVNFAGKYWAAISYAGNPTPRPTVFEMLQTSGGISTTAYDCTADSWRCSGHSLFTLRSNSGVYNPGDYVSTWIQECSGDCDQFEYIHETCPMPSFGELGAWATAAGPGGQAITSSNGTGLGCGLGVAPTYDLLKLDAPYNGTRYWSRAFGSNNAWTPLPDPATGDPSCVYNTYSFPWRYPTYGDQRMPWTP